MCHMPRRGLRWGLLLPCYVLDKACQRQICHQFCASLRKGGHWYPLSSSSSSGRACQIALSYLSGLKGAGESSTANSVAFMGIPGSGPGARHRQPLPCSCSPISSGRGGPGGSGGAARGGRSEYPQWKAEWEGFDTHAERASSVGLSNSLAWGMSIMLAGIPQIKPPFLDIAPAGIPPNIIPHSKSVKCSLIHSNSTLS